MSRLEELIQELCPDGVEFKRLVSVVNVLYGYPLDSKHFTDDPSFTPLIRIRDVKPGYSETFYKGEVPDGYIIHKGDILVGMDGEFNLARWNSCDAILNQRVCKLSSKDETIVLNGYIHHLLAPKFKEIENSIQGSTVKHLSAKVINNLQIPVPPLPVQEEIVRILDNFTELTTELTTELEARKKQYEYYRDKLLTFDVHGGGTPECGWKTLGDIIVSLNTGLNPRQFFKLNTDDAYNYYVTIREIQNGTIVFSKKTDRINDTALRLCNNRSNLEVGDVLFSGTGTIGETAVVSTPPTNWNIKEGVYAIKPKKDILNPRYLMYILRTDSLKTAIAKKVAGGTVKSIPMAEMRKLQIPVPPLDVQKRLVHVLDNFDAICSDLKIGLPAEIEARQKQYEYYRDKLLTFKELGA